MSMKQLDVDKVHEAIDITIQALHEKENQMRDVEVALNNFINLEDAFRGQGGQAIRNFYATCHIPFIQFFRLFMHDYEHTLQQIKQSLDIVEPASGGFIDQAFIENDVQDGLDRVSKTTMALTDSVNDTLRSIQDIISIPLIDDSDVQQAIHVAKREANTTVDKVLQFDHMGTASLQYIKESLRTLSKYVMEMHGAMDSGHLSVKGFSADQLQHLPTHGTLTEVLENRASQVTELTGSYPKQRLNVLDRTSLDALARIRKIRKMQEHREKIEKIYTDVTKNGPGALQKGKQYLKDFGMISSRILLSNATIKKESWWDKTVSNTSYAVNKSLESFGILYDDFRYGLKERNEKKFDSVYDFANYISVGAWGGYNDTVLYWQEQALEDPSLYNISNFVTIGAVDTFKNAANPDEPFSPEHWSSFLGVAAMTGGGAAGSTVGRTVGTSAGGAGVTGGTAGGGAGATGGAIVSNSARVVSTTAAKNGTRSGIMTQIKSNAGQAFNHVKSEGNALASQVKDVLDSNSPQFSTNYGGISSDITSPIVRSHIDGDGKGSGTGNKGKNISHPVLDNTRSGSALKNPDGQHGFNDIIDNYTLQAKEFDIVGGDGVKRQLYQIEGGMKYYDFKDIYNTNLKINERITSVKDQTGVFEWIVDPTNGVTHRRFIPNGQITGSPNQRP
ncbi:LXG domain-containing protein [Salipaludibacillus agaradhaerens]|uniref:LXG domain-containing protein n=1 Tax=Salipaludibacillus agaradhaerens TaxID=76935 RepID=A0A9Q4AZT7_SALAG|nr:LXG domain-containing protein [Salipaludibacillus agaradhaerens]MCR6095427.1 LXG domain-containing protein [Salipaludibacillus agaradhaerens]MCR6115013.1 LXG domain-containing protein [Salipaludibacillus agaradhaerens]